MRFFLENFKDLVIGRFFIIFSVLIMLYGVLVARLLASPSVNLLGTVELYQTLTVAGRFMLLLFVSLLLFHMIQRWFWDHLPLGIFYMMALALMMLYLLDLWANKSFFDHAFLVKQEFVLLLSLLVGVLWGLPVYKLSMRGGLKFMHRCLSVFLQAALYSIGLFFLASMAVFCVNYFLGGTLLFWIYQLLFLTFFVLFFFSYILCNFPLDLSTLNDDFLLTPLHRLLLHGVFNPFLLGVMFLCYGFLFVFGMRFPPLFFSIVVLIWSILVLYKTLIARLINIPFEFKLFSITLRNLHGFAVPLLFFGISSLVYLWHFQGITEFWYLIFLGLMWVTGIFFALVSIDNLDLRIVPLSLFVLLILITFTPLQPFQVAVSSHYKLLKQQLFQYGYLDNNGIFVLDKQEIMPVSEQHKVLNNLYFLDQRQSLYLLRKHYPYSIGVNSVNLARLRVDLNLERQQ